MRVILDTNVWVSGLLFPHSNAGKILKEWQRARFEIVVFPYLLEEIGRVLAYPKIKKRLQWDEAKIQNYLDFLMFFAEFIDSKEHSGHVERDPNDSPILSALINSKADFLVSGDNDLLSLKEEYPVLSIIEYLNRMGR